MTIQDPSPSNKDDSANKIKTLKQVPEESVPELIRLVHANYNNKNFLAKEFSEVWHKKNELSKLPMTKIVSKITEIAEYQKSEVLTRKAWMVKEQFLKQYGILEPAIPNNWEYLLEQPMKKVTVSTPSTPTINNQRFVDCERIQTLFLIIFEIIFHGFILFIDWGNSILFCKFDKLAIWEFFWN